MTGSTSSLVEDGIEKSPTLPVETSSPSSNSVFTISDENNDGNVEGAESKVETSNLAPELPVLDSMTKNTNASTEAKSTKSNPSSQHATTTLPPIVIHKQPTVGTLNGKNAKVSREVAVDAFHKNVKDEGESMHPTRDQSVDFEDNVDLQLRKMSCCYGCGVFLILFLGLAALTSLVIYAGFWYLLQQEDKNVLLVGMGGENTNPSSEMQAVSLPNFANISKCSPPPPYPIALSGTIGIFWQRKVVICGGQTHDGTALRKCYRLQRQRRIWKFDNTLKMRKPRSFAASAAIRPNSNERKEWWITGGRDGHNSLQRGTEIFFENEFVSGPNLEMGVSHHCLVELSNVKTMLIGGQTSENHRDYYEDDEEDNTKENLYSRKVSVYDWSTMEWKRMKRLNEGRHSHSCSQTEDKSLVVVAGGLRGLDEPSYTIEVFDVNIEEWKVLENSKLPWEVIGIPFIPYKVPGSKSAEAPTLFRAVDTVQDRNDERQNKIESKSMTNTGIIQLLNNGDFMEHSNISKLSSLKIRSHGIILIVPKEVVCF